MVKATTLSYFQSLLNKLKEANPTTLTLMKVLECAYYIVDGDLRHQSVLQILQMVGDEVNETT